MPKLTNRQRGRCKRGHEFAGANIMIGAGGVERCRICWEIAVAVAHDRRDRAVRAKRATGLKVKIRHYKRQPQTPLTEHALAVAREKLHKVQRPFAENPKPSFVEPSAPPAGTPEQDESFGVTAKDIADLS